MTFKMPEKYRVHRGVPPEFIQPDAGMFFVPTRLGQPPLKVIASGGKNAVLADLEPWEHVSVSTPSRCPTWDEMCKVKSIFWDDEDCVMQLHPPRSRWISNHPYCLHLWRPIDATIPQPPDIMVGIQAAGELPR